MYNFIFLKKWNTKTPNKLDLSYWETQTPENEDSGVSDRDLYDSEDEFLDQFKDEPKTTHVIDLRGLGEDHLLMRYATETEPSTAEKLAQWPVSVASQYRKRAAYEAIVLSDDNKTAAYLSLNTHSLADPHTPACKPEVHIVTSVDEVKSIIADFKRRNNLGEHEFLGGYLFKNGYCIAEANYNGGCMVKVNGNYQNADTLPF